jgi:restriction endonuclease Mrr
MIPSYDRFFVPALQAVEAGAGLVDEVAAGAATRIGLDEAARREVIAYDGTPVHVARTREALRDLRRAGLVSEDEGGRFRLTDRGRSTLDRAPSALGKEDLAAFPAYASYRERFLARRGA